MPRVVGYTARCPCGYACRASYDCRGHLWAMTCPRCCRDLDWRPRYAKKPKVGALRDQQRSKVYRAETAAGAHVGVLLDEDWKSHVGVILDSAGIRPGRVKVGDGRGARRAFANAHRVVLPRWARTVMMACHEVAHTVVCRNPWPDPGHGPTWAAVYLALVRRHCHPAEHAALHAEFTKAKVKVDWDFCREFHGRLLLAGGGDHG